MTATHQSLLMPMRQIPQLISSAQSFVPGNTHATSLACTMPGSIVAGNLLVALCTCKGNSGTPTSLTASGSWSTAGTFLSAAQRCLNVFYMTAAGGDTLTITPNISSFMGADILQFSPAGGNPEVTTHVTGINPPSVTPSFSDELIAIAVAFANATGVFSSYPSGYTLNQLNAGPGGTPVANEPQIGRAMAVLYTRGAAVNPAAFVITSSGNACTTTVLIRSKA